MLTKRTAILFGGLFLCLAAVAAMTMFHFDPVATGHQVADLATSDFHWAEFGLAAMRASRLTAVNDMKAILTVAETEDRDLTAEEQAKFDALKASKELLDKRIARIEGLEASEVALNAAVPALSRRAGIERAGGAEASREFENLGEFLHAVRFNPNDQRLNFVEGVGNAEGEGDDLRSEMRMDNNTTGGFMVPTQHRDTIMRVPAEEALVRPRANVIEAGTPPDAAVSMPALDQTGTAPANVFGGMQFSWIGEGEDKPETDTKLREITLIPHEIAGHVVITDKLLRNWSAANSFVEGLMREGVTAAEEYAFKQGNGVHKPLGLLYAGATKWINRTTSNLVLYADLVNMVARLLMRGAQQPVWSMPQSVLPQIAQLKDGNNNLIWHPDAKLGFAGTLLGYPVRWDNSSPALGSKGDVMLADWSQYLIKDGSGPFVATSEHVKFLQNKTVIKIFWNVDGAPWLTAPIKEANGYEVSPFIGLDVPA